jgi:hypothetical protein
MCTIYVHHVIVKPVMPYCSTTVTDTHAAVTATTSRPALSEDKKEHAERVTYTEVELESLDTQDPLWNAAHASVSTLHTCCYTITGFPCCLL